MDQVEKWRWESQVVTAIPEQSNSVVGFKLVCVAEFSKISREEFLLLVFLQYIYFDSFELNVIAYRPYKMFCIK